MEERSLHLQWSAYADTRNQPRGIGKAGDPAAPDLDGSVHEPASISGAASVQPPGQIANPCEGQR